MKLMAWLRSTWRAVTGSRQLNANMQAEMRFHIEMEAERLVREERLQPDEARRQAHIRFGGVENFKEQARDTRGLPWLDAVSLDARLGARMLIKHRWLTLVGGFAMAVAIAIGAIFFEVMSEAMNPALPLPGGDRIVAVQFATDVPGSPERKVLRDFLTLRTELKSIDTFSAFREVQLNFAAPDAPPEPVRLAEITASGFTVAGTPPLLGRYLVPDDERPGAPAVVVIGYVEWKKRFNLDPQIVGRAVSVGGVASTIVGVMPNGFRFPVNHQFWIPLRENPLQYKPMRGQEVFLFGRLAPGISISQAQAELTTVGDRLAVTRDNSRNRLGPVVNPYTREFSGMVTPARLWFVRIAQLLVSALAFVVAVNLAILIYARTVARMGEIAIRTALGASRRRILSQLFMEAFALSLVGAGAGLALAATALGQVQMFVFIGGGSPFWVDYEMSFGTVIYAFTIAVAAAFVMGVVPGLKATSRGVNANLQQLGGRTGARLGAMWTALVVAQIAVAVAILPAAVYLSWLAIRMELIGPGFATDNIVVSVGALGDDSSVVDNDLWRTRQSELLSKLAEEPGVSAVTFTSAVPGFGPGGREIEVDSGSPAQAARAGEASSIYGGVNMLDFYGAQIVGGRGFETSDLDAANQVVVNQTFVASYFNGRSPRGARFRYSNLPGWYEVIGVVKDFPAFPPSITMDGEAVIYHAVSTGTTKAVIFSAKYAGVIPDGILERFRHVAAEVDPAIQLRRVVPLSKYYRDVRSLWRNLAWAVGLVTSSVLLLSAAGIYALMSLAVAQRTREIGIRTALGAEPRGLILSIFARSTRQIALGLVVGSMLSAVICTAAEIGSTRAAALIGAVAVIMSIVGLLSALGPARRILRVQATDALRSEG